jgi:sialidase-1
MKQAVKKSLCAILLPATLLASEWQMTNAAIAQTSPGPRAVDVFVGDRIPDKSTPKEGYDTFRIPALVSLPDGDLLAFCEARRDSVNDHGKIDLVLRRSTDNGKTWSGLTIIHGEEGRITIGNPVPIVARDGTIHLVFCRNNRLGLLHTFSTDRGQTWSKPREIFDAKGNPGLPDTVKVPMYAVLTKMLGNDVQTFATGPGRGLQLRSGRLVVPMWYGGMIKVPFTGPRLPAEALTAAAMQELHPTRPELRYNGVIYSDDNGKTWRVGAPGPMGTNETTVTELADGTLVLNARFITGTQRVISESKDGGQTFTEHRIDSTLIDVACQGSSLTAALPNNAGEALLFCNPAVKGIGFNRRAKLTLRLSRDGGRTWPHAVEIDSGPSAYSDIAILQDGKSVGVLYERGDKEYHERIAFTTVTLEQLLQSSATSSNPVSP